MNKYQMQQQIEYLQKYVKYLDEKLTKQNEILNKSFNDRLKQLEQDYDYQIEMMLSGYISNEIKKQFPNLVCWEKEHMYVSLKNMRETRITINKDRDDMCFGVVKFSPGSFFPQVEIFSKTPSNITNNKSITKSSSKYNTSNKFKSTDKTNNFKITPKGLFFGSTQYKHIYDKEFSKTIVNLINLAQEEDWSLSNNDNYILKQYLIHIYYKSYIDKLIINNKEQNIAIFNTGLRSRNSNKDICCKLVKKEDKWIIDCFGCSGDGNGKRFLEDFGRLPKAPNFILQTSMFDNKEFEKSLQNNSPDWTHILKGNFNRLPLSFLEKIFNDKYEIIEIIKSLHNSKGNRVTLCEQLKNKVLFDSELSGIIVDNLNNVINQAIKQDKWNHTNAIPCYYARRNIVSHMLPLYLTKNDVPDLALVVEKINNNYYQAHTILTLEMAYTNARLIGRQNSEWLTLANIKSSANGNDNENVDE